MAQFYDTKNLIYNYNVLDLDAFTCVHLTDAFTCVHLYNGGGGRVERRCWVNFQCWGVLLDDSRARAYCACSRCG